MTDEKEIDVAFEASRDRLRAVAYRMLGSRVEADDAVQETWLRLHRTEAETIANLSGWLTTVVARVSLDMLRSRKSRREDAGAQPDEAVDTTTTDGELLLADSIGAAMLVVLETLDPAERIAFVLHDTFGVPFEEIAPIVSRTPAAARQLASRARRRVQGASPAMEADRARQTEIVRAFLTASRGGDFAALLTLLDPDVVVHADAAAVALGAKPDVRGIEAFRAAFVGRARGARAAWVDGMAGAAWVVDTRPKVVFDFTVRDGRIVRLDLIAAPDALEAITVELTES